MMVMRAPSTLSRVHRSRTIAFRLILPVHQAEPEVERSGGNTSARRGFRSSILSTGCRDVRVSGTTNLRSIATISPQEKTRLVLSLILVIAGVGSQDRGGAFTVCTGRVEGNRHRYGIFVGRSRRVVQCCAHLRRGHAIADADWRLLFEALSIVTMNGRQYRGPAASRISRISGVSSIAHSGYLRWVRRRISVGFSACDLSGRLTSCRWAPSRSSS